MDKQMAEVADLKDPLAIEEAGALPLGPHEPDTVMSLLGGGGLPMEPPIGAEGADVIPIDRAKED